MIERAPLALSPQLEPDIQVTVARAEATDVGMIERARSSAVEHRLRDYLTVVQGVSITLRDHTESIAPTDQLLLLDSLVRNVSRLTHEIESLLMAQRDAGE